VKFSLKVPGLDLFPGRGQHWWRDIRPEEIVSIVRRVEELGYDHVNVTTHMAMDSDSAVEMGPRWTHSLSAAGFVLGATTRLRVVCLVVVPYQQPIELAKALATLDFLSGGRLTVLALVGYKPWEFELLGVPFAERGAITDEYVDAMRALWTQERPSFHGQRVQFDDVVFEPRPVQDPLPLWFGGRTKAAMRRIARVGDGWIPYATPRSRFREMVEHCYAQPEFQARPRRLELGLELFAGELDPDTHALIEQPRIVAEKDWVLEQVAAISALGATVTSVDEVIGAGRFQNGQPGALPPIRGFSDHLERLQWFAEEIMPDARRVAAEHARM